MEYAAALKAVDERLVSSNTPSGSMAALIDEYLRSSEVADLSLRTKDSKRLILQKFRAEFGQFPVKDLERSILLKIKDRMVDRKGAFNALLVQLKVLMKYAIDRGFRPDDPTANIKGFKVKAIGHIAWSNEEIQQFRCFWGKGTMERLALELGLHTASRCSDLHRLGWANLNGAVLSFEQEKTHRDVALPLTPELMEMLNELPRDRPTFLVHIRG
jgi:enterobacteria phage integrase